MSAAVEVARQQWEEGHRRVQEAPDARRRHLLLASAEAVTEEIRRRIGQSFTLEELAQLYADAEGWVLEVIEDETVAGADAELATALDAAFHAYARGARDFVP